jgi:hypothetical protein
MQGDHPARRLSADSSKGGKAHRSGWNAGGSSGGRREGGVGLDREADLHHVGDARVHDDRVGGEPAQRADDGRLPQSLVAAELASGWTGGVCRRVSEVLSAKWACWQCGAGRDDELLLPDAARVRGEHARVRLQSRPADNGVYIGAVIAVVFWLGVFMLARGGIGGIAELASSGLLLQTCCPEKLQDYRDKIDDLKTTPC